MLLVRARLPADMVSGSLLLFCFYMLVTVPIYQNNLLALQYAILFSLLFGVYLVFQKLLQNDRNYLSFLRSLILLQSLVSIIGAFDFVLFEFGYESAFRDYSHANKVDSLFANPNPMGIVSAICLCLLQTRGLFARKLKIIAAGCLLAGVLFSQSSAAFVIVVVFFLLLYLGRDVVMLLGLVLVLFLIFGPEVNWIAIFNKRIDIWTKAYLMWQEYPWFGLGTGNFQINSQFFEQLPHISNLGLHSMYAWMLFEIGIIGCAIFLGFLGCLLIASWRQDRVLRLAIVAMLISQLTEFYLDHEEIYSMIFLALAARASREREARDAEAA
jgi:O-antigen ligase